MPPQLVDTSVSAERPSGDLRKLVIIDQSLRSCDGHHLEYSGSVAKAASEAGLVVVVAAHKEVSHQVLGMIPHVRPHFTQSWTNQPNSWLKSHALRVLSMMPHVVQDTALDVRKCFSSLRSLIRDTESEAAYAPIPPSPFGKELLNLIVDESLRHCDHLLIHTVSVAEIFSLIDTFSDRPVTNNPSPLIHIVLRRDAEEPTLQPTAHGGGMKGALAALTGHPVLRHRVRLYCDTEHLAAQYRALAPRCTFQVLPIPHFLNGPRPSTIKSGPPSVTYLGNARVEKGFHLMADAANALYNTHLRHGKLRFVLQANANLSLEAPIIARARRRLALFPESQVKLLGKELDTRDFFQTLRKADVIVLPYDASLYARRSSGIFVQALVMGRPVVVPAGTWMSDTVSSEASVRFSQPERLADAIAEAIDLLPILTAAASKQAPSFSDHHRASALVKMLVS